MWRERIAIICFNILISITQVVMWKDYSKCIDSSDGDQDWLYPAPDLMNADPDPG